MKEIKKKVMHPRNIYNKPPNFTDLAIKYPNFRKLCELKLNGEVKADFNKPGVVRELTKALLLEDFQLNVEFPKICLVPTIPLRLNYLLWLEDIINVFELKDIQGIDIGCGAAAIYSLLAARKNNWKMFGIEADKENVDFAMMNIKNNSLDNLISVFHQIDSNKIFEDFFDTEENKFKNFTFCICNPPFYNKDEHENPEEIKIKNSRKRKYKNTGKTLELSYEGGEVAFIKKMIDESVKFKEKILIYSTMLGHEKSIPELINHLKELQITNILQTEFCQGKRTRWGLAWSHSNELKLEKCQKFCIGESKFSGNEKSDS